MRDNERLVPVSPKPQYPELATVPTLPPSVPCPAVVATTNLKLTHKVLESQSAGEGDAQEFILGIFSLTPLFSAPSVDEAAAGICVLTDRLTLTAQPLAGGRWGEGRKEGGASLG